MPNTRLNLILANTPSWTLGLAHVIWPSHPSWGSVEDIEILRQAAWPGSFAAPELRAPTESDEGPALLMLHVFSMPNAASRRRRSMIRTHNPDLSVPSEYRHLVEIKFVLGRIEIREGMSDVEKEEIKKEEKEIELEQAVFGDLIRLDNLKHGENMNEGKTLEWIRWVGRPGGREAQWVMKCDDDTFPLLPNLLPFLLKLDGTQPTYIGTALGHFAGYAYYFEGMMYGFNWGVVKTLATAELHEWHLHRRFDEDAYTGLLMYNLPSKPDIDPQQAEYLRLNDPSNGGPSVPKSPDPRTGLVRVDLGNRAGSFDRWWIAGSRRAVAWHNLKFDESWLSAKAYAVDGFRASGRDFMWIPPKSFERYADTRPSQRRRRASHEKTSELSGMRRTLR